jgi:hypothetical protein
MGTVLAEEETLKFRLVTMPVEANFFDASNVEGHSVGGGHYAGVAYFEDDRVAHKDYVVSIDSAGAEGSYSGYSTYTFQNGDSLTLRFTGGWGADRNGGDYEVLSGTGAYEGATGSGRFDAVEESWENAELYDVTLTVNLGG